jgi:Divergent InlB B-repeat domain/PASTA domain
VFVLLCLAALAVLVLSAGWSEHDNARAGAGDPDAGQVAPPPAPNQPRTSPNAYFRAEAQAAGLQGGPTLSWTPVGKGPINGGYGPSAPGGGTTPPWSGRGTSIAVSRTVSTDHTAYLGTSDGGVWKTTDDGLHWSAIFDQAPTLSIGAVAVDPTAASTVYVGTGEANWQLDTGEILLGDGIYRSTDGGSTWSHAAIPFASGYMGGGCAVPSLDVDPAHPATLIAAVYCPGTSDSTATALIRSTDAGASWSPVGPAVGSKEDEAPSVTFDTSDSTGATWYATIAATGGLAGVWKSTDSGATWTQALHTVPSGEYDTWSAPRGVVAVSPTDHNKLYALFEASYACTGSGCLYCGAGACGNATAVPQLWTSTDAGAHWTQIDNADAGAYNTPDAQYLCGTGTTNQCSSTLTMAVSPSDSSVVYVGALNPAKLTISGSSSTLANLQAPIHADERAFAFDTEGRLWVANDGGVYRFPAESTMDTSVDNLNADLPTVQIYRLSVDPAGDILIATQDLGCDLYTPGGGWKQLGWGVGGTSEPMGCGDSSAAIISSVHPGAMYAEVQYQQWIVRSLDGGDTIDHIQLTGDCTTICAPFMDPLVEEPSTGSLLGGANSKVWRSDNPNAPGFDAASWTAISPQFDWYPGAIAAAPSDAQTIYVGSSAYSNVTNQMGIEVTHSGGGIDPSNWSLGSGCCGFAPVTDIEVDPSHPSHAYATTSSWPPQAPRAGISTNGATSQVYETTDGGASWHIITGNLPAAPYNAIAVDWSFPRQTIYVATDVGVFWSEDDGTIWHASSSGLPNVSVQDLALQKINGAATPTLYAATFGRGVYSVAPISTVLRTLVITKSGSGTVTSNPAGVDCGSTCAYDFADGASVMLTASAAAGSTFTGWSGACSGTSTTCQLALTSDRSATANFAPNPHLTVSTQGTGNGSVTSSPAGISCGSTCSSAGFSLGSTVTLTASAASGSTFTGWSGACSGTAPTCQLSMTADRSATATFTADPLLTVSTSGSGSGTVTSSPAGISCGSTCSRAFALGSSVTLTATAASGSTFTGWSGDCTGTASTCQLPMTAAHSATATFDAQAAPPPPPSPSCIVPRLKGKTLAAAKRALGKAHCALGTVKKAYSSGKKGTVVGQRAKPGSRHANGFKVGVTVSKGRKP